MMRLAWLAIATAVIGCGPDRRSTDGEGPDASRCVDGETRCDGQSFSICSNGEFVHIEDCPMVCSSAGCTESCDPGVDCMSTECSKADADKSYLGCEYWAVDLPNAIEVLGPPIPNAGHECDVYGGGKLVSGVAVCDAGGFYQGRCDPGGGCPAGSTCATPPQVCAADAEHSPFAIVVSNPGASVTSVTLANAAGTTMTFAVDANSMKTLFPQQLGFTDHSTYGTGKVASAYRVTATSPVVAYQFNPLDDVDVFSNDASLLIPRLGFADNYVAVSWPTLTRRPTRDDYNGFVAIVAWHDNTQIEIIPRANTVAGVDGTPALTVGQPYQVTLNAFDVLNLEAVAGPDAQTPGGDLTGSLISGRNGTTFGVFGGHEAVQVTTPDSTCCADHLEEMLFPTATWGKNFAIHRTQPRNNQPDQLRIVAATAGTQVTISPPPLSGSCPLLAANAHCDILINQPTEIATSHPATVAHLMLSTIQGQTGEGDPSLGIVPPLEQHRTDYKFLAPVDYDQQYVNIVGQSGDQIKLDGAAVTNATPFGTARIASTVAIGPGPHRVECPLKCSVEVYGWSKAVSYLFAGGLDLQPLILQ